MRAHWLIYILFIGACSTVRVQTSYSPKHDFENYKTWCWLNGCQPSYDGPKGIMDSAFMDKISNEIAIEMQRKGFTQLDDSADILLDYHIVLSRDSSNAGWVQEQDLQFWDPYKEEDYYHFMRGSLIIDITDREQGEIIWKSTSKKVMSLRETMSDAELRKAIRRAMKKFPPH
ncbi:DUF4136 domain-containing protein [Fulvivirga ligni]|uniref:DUF4136 domain-containing protein n=1 Tax=Fulvivirga ligni TaxID=2904246 RepID=UPI001F483DCA|nr:DUF4136 domain-containing protein [Fulvivirga ligni]UII19087.1 DUF4136 domain-containing protein [Fulvivirga ligni]